MHQLRLKTIATLSLVVSTWLTGCGGGGSSSPFPSPAPDSVISGTAAIGSALANAQVSIVDHHGVSPCKEVSIVTTGTGGFTCTLIAGAAAPFFISVIDPAGVVAPLVSVTTQTPIPGTPLVVNATPLTTAIVAQLAGNHDPLSVFNSHVVDATALAQTTSNVVAQLQPVLASIGAPTGYDPFATNITAASTGGPGNTADLVLDVVRIGTDGSGNLTLGTVDSTSVVAMATATQAGTPLAAANASVSSLAAAMLGLAQTFRDCFALPTAQRVLARDTTIPYSQGGSTVTQVAPACRPLVDATFLQNGFNAGQYFYGNLTSDTMTGAQFSVPQIMQFFVKSSIDGLDIGVVNIRFIDANGNAGNYITVEADKGTGTATPNWVLYGNHHPVDMLVRASIRLLQQQADTTMAPFNATAPQSTFQTGIEFYVDKNGPGSINLTAARVTGPGLPASGLVLNRPIPAQEAQQSWLNIADKFGGDPAVVASQQTNCNCDIFWLQRTQGIAGAAASAIRNNPNGGNSNNTQYVQWAHPLDYGAAPGTPSDQYVPFASFAAGAPYKVELFYGGSGTPTYTFFKTLLSPVIPATRGAQLAWNAPTLATLALLDPSNALAAAAPSFPVSWMQNPSAEQIRLVQIFGGNGPTTVSQGNGIGIPKGASSVVVSAPSGLQFTQLDSSGASYRSVQLSYRTFDNSLKLAIYRYN